VADDARARAGASASRTAPAPTKTLADWRGRVVLLNLLGDLVAFRASKEMPALAGPAGEARRPRLRGSWPSTSTRRRRPPSRKAWLKEAGHQPALALLRGPRARKVFQELQERPERAIGMPDNELLVRPPRACEIASLRRPGRMGAGADAAPRWWQAAIGKWTAYPAIALEQDRRRSRASVKKTSFSTELAAVKRGCGRKLISARADPSMPKKDAKLLTPCDLPPWGPSPGGDRWLYFPRSALDVDVAALGGVAFFGANGPASDRQRRPDLRDLRRNLRLVGREGDILCFTLDDRSRAFRLLFRMDSVCGDRQRPGPKRAFGGARDCRRDSDGWRSAAGGPRITWKKHVHPRCCWPPIPDRPFRRLHPYRFCFDRDKGSLCTAGVHF